MTALNTTLWFLADPNLTNKLMARTIRFTMLIQYHGVKAGKTVAVKR